MSMMSSPHLGSRFSLGAEDFLLVPNRLKLEGWFSKVSGSLFSGCPSLVRATKSPTSLGQAVGLMEGGQRVGGSLVSQTETGKSWRPSRPCIHDLPDLLVRGRRGTVSAHRCSMILVARPCKLYAGFPHLGVAIDDRAWAA